MSPAVESRVEELQAGYLLLHLDHQQPHTQTQPRDSRTIQPDSTVCPRPVQKHLVLRRRCCIASRFADPDAESGSKIPTKC